MRRKINPMPTMQIRLTEKHISGILKLVDRGLYPNKSEAVRDAIRKFLGDKYDRRRKRTN